MRLAPYFLNSIPTFSLTSSETLSSAVAIADPIITDITAIAILDFRLRIDFPKIRRNIGYHQLSLTIVKYLYGKMIYIMIVVGMTIKIDCEESVWYLLPLIRKEFAKSLIKDHGLTQRKAAERLGITESAVSQYVSKKRGDFKVNDGLIRREIKESTKRIMNGDIQVMKTETCRICHLLRAHGFGKETNSKA